MSLRNRHITHTSVFVILCALAFGTLSFSAPVEAADPIDPEVVLPARVDTSLNRTFDAVDRAVAMVDDRRKPGAWKALRAAREGFARSNLAILRQVQAPVDPESEVESTAGPDSMLAGLNVDQYAITRLSSLFDGVTAPGIIERVTLTLAEAQTARAELIAVVVALDPEEAGLPYADALIDTVTSYADEVAAISEAIADDRLTPESRNALVAALARSVQAEAQMTAAFGGAD